MKKQPIEIEIDASDAVFLRIPTPVYAKTLIRAINEQFTVNTLPRFAPLNRDANNERLHEIAAKYEIEPQLIRRPIHIYCGNNYVPTLADVGSNNYCLRRGHAAVNKT